METEIRAPISAACAGDPYRAHKRRLDSADSGDKRREIFLRLNVGSVLKLNVFWGFGYFLVRVLPILKIRVFDDLYFRVFGGYLWRILYFYKFSDYANAYNNKQR